jgi:oxygen-independent coproporphyrinogen-3 oxidase
VAQYGHGAHAQELIDAHKRGQEMLLMGLRLSEGLDLSRFQQESGRSFSDFVNQSSLKIMQDEGLIDLMPDRVTATAKGRQRLNAVLGQLLA